MQDNAIIAYGSRKMKLHEQNYVVYDLELLLVINALKMWRHYFLANLHNDDNFAVGCHGS